MRIPHGSNSKLDIFAKWLVRFYSSSWLIKFLLVPIVLSAPPTLIAACYSNKALKAFIKTQAPQFASFAAPIANDYVWLFVTFIGLYPIVLMSLGKEIHKRAHSNGLNVEGLLSLINSLDQIVGAKNSRFSRFSSSSTAGLTKENAFCTITDPDKQIAEIIKEICLFFNATRTDAKKLSLIRVTLAVMTNGKIANLPVYYPSDEPIRASLQSLNAQKSAFLTAARTKKMVLIPDIAKELKRPKDKRKFVETENEEDNNGSIICYPVRCGSSVPFVISVHCDEIGYFKNEFKDLYEHSLQRFALRMNVEYNLFVIKEKLCGRQDSS